jgi:hypothetical protein
LSGYFLSRARTMSPELLEFEKAGEEYDQSLK